MGTFVMNATYMEFYRLRKDLYINASDFCEAVYCSSFRFKREPSGLDAERVIPELLNMLAKLSHSITYYDFMSANEIVESMKDAHLRGIHKVFDYGTYNTEFIIKKAYESGDLKDHLCYCYNRIWEYIDYLSPAQAA